MHGRVDYIYNPKKYGKLSTSFSEMWRRKLTYTYVGFAKDVSDCTILDLFVRGASSCDQKSLLS